MTGNAPAHHIKRRMRRRGKNLQSNYYNYLMNKRVL